YHCFAGCSQEEIRQALEKLGVKPRDLGLLSKQRRPGGGTGCTLKGYATVKRLKRKFLKKLGVGEISYLGRPAVRMPYFDEAGNERIVRFRLAMERSEERDDRFQWRKGSKLMPYGLWRLDKAKTAGEITIVEGESDAQTLWSHDIPAIGIPGAGSW